MYAFSTGRARFRRLERDFSARVFDLKAQNASETFTIRKATAPCGGSSSALMCSVGGSASTARNLELGTEGGSR